MKLAMAIHNQRISPVFDTARRLLLLELKGRKVIRRKETALKTDPLDKAAQLAKLKVEALICGAVSQPLAQMLAMQGIVVTPFVAGEAEEVIRAFLEDRLTSADFAMPGCCGRGFGRGPWWKAPQKTGSMPGHGVRRGRCFSRWME
ncbi:MAG: NifB/NifX family molybdenum-iron cluster-binding protein [Verrucomicrobiae bacterium]|nr:NifB/NifX family molybdenum-iron cluster-binding protein [Verrucomicrobiae bacterium]